MSLIEDNQGSLMVISFIIRVVDIRVVVVVDRQCIIQKNTWLCHEYINRF
jgi:hypothetical protein